jgi:selenide,water dikinase
MIIDAGRVPAIEGVMAMVRLNHSGGMASNQDYFGREVQVSGLIDEDVISLLFDPQTSGGLLVAVAPESADRVAATLGAAGVQTSRMGETCEPIPGIRVTVRP